MMSTWIGSHRFDIGSSADDDETDSGERDVGSCLEELFTCKSADIAKDGEELTVFFLDRKGLSSPWSILAPSVSRSVATVLFANEGDLSGEGVDAAVVWNCTKGEEVIGE
jgi:hypothetical protein